jgi:hypothetical protein
LCRGSGDCLRALFAEQLVGEEEADHKADDETEDAAHEAAREWISTRRRDCGGTSAWARTWRRHSEFFFALI